MAAQKPLDTDYMRSEDVYVVLKEPLQHLVHDIVEYEYIVYQ